MANLIQFELAVSTTPPVSRITVRTTWHSANEKLKRKTLSPGLPMKSVLNPHREEQSPPWPSLVRNFIFGH